MEVGAAVTAVRAAIEAARAAKDVNDQAQFNAAMSEVMEKLATAQSDLVSLLVQQQELVEENRHLKEKLAKEEQFERYRLSKTPMGHFVHTLKEEHVTEDEPAHAICAVCRQDGRLSILQEDEYRYFCQTCKNVAEVKEMPDFAVTTDSTFGGGW
ncbi:hypothetical protein [Halomonas stenophila]|uniref:Regulator of replication initiation timing n=1 Tax=Halomonas stenophila TaxID=795312 RepID=A0A7W5ETW3_9GAMM|nr:hypothetical protein [Halomonas stenophila]MBB3230962.1 regulator of replication initiation timing [Halomonas stenophila]